MSSPDPADEEASIYLAEQKAPKQRSSPIGAFIFFLVFVIVSVGVTLYGNRNSAPLGHLIGYTNSISTANHNRHGVFATLYISPDGFQPVADQIATQFEFSTAGTAFKMKSRLPWWNNESLGSITSPIMGTNGLAAFARNATARRQFAFVSRRPDSTNTSILAIEWDSKVSARISYTTPVGTVYPGAVLKNSGSANKLHGQTWTTPDSVTNIISHFETHRAPVAGSRPTILLPGPGQTNDGDEVLLLLPTLFHLGAIHAVRSKAESLTYFSVLSMRP
ncbi:MAG: hypothetical protein ACKVHO_10235 [Verrucomicrobiia bacterium]|jgi:hypothetical protein